MNEVEIRVKGSDVSGPVLAGAEAGAKKMATAVAAASLKVEKASKDAAAATERYGKESLEARTASNRLAQAQEQLGVAEQAAAKDTAKLTAAVREVGPAAEEGSDRALGALRQLSGGAGRAAKGLAAGLKTGLVAAVSAAGAAAAAALTTAITSKLDFNASNDKLRAQLGVGAKEAGRLGKIAGELYVGNFGDSMDQVNEALRSVTQSGAVMEDATSAELKQLTGNVLSLAATFDQDLGAATRAVGQMIRTGLVKDGKQAMDILTAGFQRGGDKAEDLLDTFNEYPTQLRKLGLSGVEAMGLIAQGLRAGARDSDIVADAFKEFSIRAVDGSELTAGAFRKLHLNVKDTVAAIASGGPAARTALGEVLDRLRAVEDPAARAGLAVALFGTQAEDLGEALYALDTDTAVAELGKVTGAADTMTATLGDNAKSRLESFKRTLQVTAAQGLDALIQGFNSSKVSGQGFMGAMSQVGVTLRGMVGWAQRNKATFIEYGLTAVEWAGRIAAALLWVVAAVAKLDAVVLHAAADMVQAFVSVISGILGAMSHIPLIGDQFAKAKVKVDEFGGAAVRKLSGAARAADGVARGAATAARKANDLATAVSRIRDRRIVLAILDRATAGLRNIIRLRDEAGRAVGIQVGLVSGPGARGYAHGGIVGAAVGGVHGGLRWVGEAGPELVRMPYGSTVYPTGQSQRMAAAGGGGPTVIEIRSGGTRLDDLLVEVLRTAINSRGGNVQATLGRG